MLSILISTVSGLLLSLAFPSWGWHWLAWVALSPMFFQLYSLPWRSALVNSAFFGVAFFLGLLTWISVFGYLPWVALAIFQAVFIIVFAISAKAIGGRMQWRWRLVLIPALWTTFEWLRSMGIFGFTWGDLGYSQYRQLQFVQVASFGGVWLLSFIMAFFNTGLAALWASSRTKISARHLALRSLVLFSFAPVFVHAMVFNRAAIHQSDGSDPSIRVAVLQGNVPQGLVLDSNFVDRSWKAYEELSAAASLKKPDLIVWPETVVPGNAGSDIAVQNRLAEISSVANADLLVGGWDEDHRGRSFNSAFLVDHSGIKDKYAKVHLVPFGEYVPARIFAPILKAYRVTLFDGSPGDGYKTINAGNYKIGAVICFESTFPDISRRMAASGADIMCIVTNDCWFDKTIAAEEHMAMSVLRAVETGKYVIRGATTGVSVIIDPTGRIVSKVDLNKEGLAEHRVTLSNHLTPYARYGNWVVWMSMLFAFSCAIWCVRSNPAARH